MTSEDKRKPVIIFCCYCGQRAAHVDYRKVAEPFEIKPSFDPSGHLALVIHYICKNCGARFRTQESYVPDKHSLSVVKSAKPNGILGTSDEPEPYNLQKIFQSLTRATRRVDPKQLWAVARRAERFLLDTDMFPPVSIVNVTRTYKSSQIGEAVMLALLSFRMITPWARYALVFHEREEESNIDDLIIFLMEKHLEHRSRLIDILRFSSAQLINEKNHSALEKTEASKRKAAVQQSAHAHDRRPPASRVNAPEEKLI
jgi:transcriptional regulator NrdR family protein